MILSMYFKHQSVYPAFERGSIFPVMEMNLELLHQVQPKVVSSK